MIFVHESRQQKKQPWKSVADTSKWVTSKVRENRQQSAGREKKNAEMLPVVSVRYISELILTCDVKILKDVLY